MEIRLNTEVSLQQAEELILAIGNTNAVHLVGQPGIGKTAMASRLAKRTGFRLVYIDTPTTDLGDLGVPMPDRETQTTMLYPNQHWGFHTGEPLVIFIDEFSKPSSQAVQNMLHPLLHERRIAGFKQHKDTIVVTAGNNSTDGVGDMMKSHSINRMTVVPIANPTAESYIEYGAEKDFAPELLAWVKAYPHCLASYKDPTQAENHMIFNPKYPQRSYFSPRSGEKASNIIKARAMFSRDTLISALCGTIGDNAGRDLVAYVEVADSLPSWESILHDPATAKIPTSPAALCIMAYGAVQKIDRGNINKWFTYLKRTPKELQSVFSITAAKNKDKRDILFTSGAFVQWMRENQYLF
jgi:hypothetical protein